MTAINRQPRLAAEKEYDLIIIGGGIYGVSLAMQASVKSMSGGATPGSVSAVVVMTLQYN